MPRRQHAMRRLCAVILLAGVAVCLQPSAHGYNITLNATQTGSYSSNGGYASPDYVTGIQFAYGAETRGFVAFDLSTLAGGTVQSAALSLQNPSATNQIGPNDPLELRLHGLTTLDAANAGGPGQTSVNQANFSYIAGAPLYASQSVSILPLQSTVVFPLTGQALTDLTTAINNHDAFAAFGLRIIKADAEEPKPIQYLFGSTAGGGTVTLTLNVVPEPASVNMLALSLVCALVARRRRPELSVQTWRLTGPLKQAAKNMLQGIHRGGWVAVMMAGFCLPEPSRAASYSESFNSASDPAALGSVGWSFISDTSNPSAVNSDFAINNSENIVKLTAVNDIVSTFSTSHLFIEHDIAAGESTINGNGYGQHKGDFLFYTTEPLTQNGASTLDLNNAVYAVDYQNGNGTLAGHSFMFAFKLSNGTWYLLDDVVVPTDSNVHTTTTDPIDVSQMTFRYLYPGPGLNPTSESYSLTAAQLQTVTAVGIYVGLGAELLPSRFDNFSLSGFTPVPEPCITWFLFITAGFYGLMRRKR